MAKRSGSKHNKTSKRHKIRRNRTLRGGLTGVTEEQIRTIAQDRYNQKKAQLERERLRKIREYNAGQDDLLERTAGTQREGTKVLDSLFAFNHS